jgi:F-type H+-transporting ATPase subunit gamma
MPNLKEVRNRITSVNSTMQITSAMKMVSAAKLKRAQDAILKLRPYSAKLSEIMNNLSGNLEDVGSSLAEQREVNKVLVVAVNSNRGLCGAFNSNVHKEVNRLVREDFAGKEVHVLGLGKKAHDTYKKTDHRIPDGDLAGEFFGIYDKLDYEHVSEIGDQLMAAYEAGAYDKIVLVYNQFKNAASQILNTESFLPVEMNEEAEASSIDYIFEPEQAEIITHLLPKALKTQLYKALLDSHASEHGARMTAMHKATDNAGELLHDLKLSYNKARQAAITTEILEIVAGAEALDS